MKTQLFLKLTMKTAHIWNPLANTHTCNPQSLTSSFRKWKKPTLSSCRDSGGFPSGQNQNQAPSLTPQTLTRTSDMPSVLTPLNKIKLGRQTEKNNISRQKLLERKRIAPFAATSPCGQGANLWHCPCIHRTVAFTEGGEKEDQIGPFFQCYLRNSQSSKVPIAPHGRCHSAQIKDREELWRTKGGCPIFRLPLAGSCTGHILQGRTRTLSTTSLSPHLTYKHSTSPPALIHWPELQRKEITPCCFQTQRW